MFRSIISAALLISMGSPAFAGLVWQSTFNTDADGVVDVRTDNPNKEMIGANTGGRQTIVTAGRQVTQADKAGRPTGTTLGGNSSFSAYYKWNWSAFDALGSDTMEEVAGFFTTTSPHSTRQFMGARFQHYVSDGDNLIRFGGSWASVGNTFVGRYFPAPDINLGPDSSVLGRDFHLVVAFDGSTKFLTTNLYDTDGTLLKGASQDIRLFDNLGFPPDGTEVAAEIDALSLTHLGWSDFIAGVITEKTRTWSVDSLAYFDDATGAFSLVPSATTATQWNVDADGNWSEVGNWSSGVPNDIGTEAQFGGKITAAHTVTIDAPQTIGTLNFDNANSYTIAGTSTLTIDVSSGSGSIKVLNGSHSIAAPIVLADDTSVDVVAGQTLSVQHLRGAGVTVNTGTLKMIAGASANSADGASKLTAVTVAGGAVLDLTNNSLVIDYTGTSVQDDVRQALESGRLTTSMADANKKLGYGEASATGFANGTFAGQSVDADAVLVKFTYGGDSNLDGKVDVGDLGNLASNWQQSAPWTGGDFDYNGTVNVGDLGILATNWQQGVTTPTLGPSFAEALAALGLGGVGVPEPAMLGLVLVLAAWSQKRTGCRRRA